MSHPTNGLLALADLLKPRVDDESDEDEVSLYQWRMKWWVFQWKVAWYFVLLNKTTRAHFILKALIAEADSVCLCVSTMPISIKLKIQQNEK